MTNRRSQGAQYESLVCSYLRDKGYKILDRNVHLLRKELDIIALDNKTIVFVEVKGRRTTRFGLPSEAVDGRKRGHLVKVASAYLEKARLWDRPCRFDVVSVMVGETEKAKFEHIENAFGV